MKKLKICALLASVLLLSVANQAKAQVFEEDPMSFVEAAILDHFSNANDLNQYYNDTYSPYITIMAELNAPTPDSSVIFENWAFNLDPQNPPYRITLGNHIGRVVTTRNNYWEFAMAARFAVIDDPGNLELVRTYANYLDSEADSLEVQLDVIDAQLTSMETAGQGYGWGLGGPDVELVNHGRSYNRLFEMRSSQIDLQVWLADQEN